MRCGYTAGPLGCGDEATAGTNFCPRHQPAVMANQAEFCITPGCEVRRHGQSLYCHRHLTAIQNTVRAINEQTAKRKVRRGTIALGTSMVLGAVFALGGYFVAGLFLADPVADLRAENARLRHALELFTRNEGSCAVQNNGPRVLCGMRDGYVARRELDANDQVVTGPVLRGPLKRKGR